VATFHFAAQPYKGGGSKAYGHVRYLTHGDVRESPAVARYQHQGERYDRPREDLDVWHARNLPGWAHGSASRFFAQAEASESSKWTAYWQAKISLPMELTPRPESCPGP
jgi:hypothetical protein